MRNGRRSSRWAPCLGLILLGALLVVPAAWATGEDVREQDAETKPAEDPKKEQQKGTPQQQDSAEEAVPAEKAPETGEGTVDPSFNTIEEILAYPGSLDALWATPAPPAPEVTWRDVGAAPARSR